MNPDDTVVNETPRPDEVDRDALSKDITDFLWTRVPGTTRITDLETLARSILVLILQEWEEPR